VIPGRRDVLRASARQPHEQFDRIAAPALHEQGVEPLKYCE
jgi:hypothetical protein